MENDDKDEEKKEKMFSWKQLKKKNEREIKL